MEVVGDDVQDHGVRVVAHGVHGAHVEAHGAHVVAHGVHGALEVAHHGAASGHAVVDGGRDAVHVDHEARGDEGRDATFCQNHKTCEYNYAFPAVNVAYSTIPYCLTP
ncbi:uncharacterized protein LOC124803097 [Schistocerca piceifrons]|uniref:uncharacterized protein LOC124803097 n=1 Tax=Schistocerca piceifrons TaxID=274613 RepID=UPI001F5EA256|nr:uncharacterized protein LOC124803097 [Schistocerca piceifrons]